MVTLIWVEPNSQLESQHFPSFHLDLLVVTDLGWGEVSTISTKGCSLEQGWMGTPQFGLPPQIGYWSMVDTINKKNRLEITSSVWCFSMSSGLIGKRNSFQKAPLLCWERVQGHVLCSIRQRVRRSIHRQILVHGRTVCTVDRLEVDLGMAIRDQPQEGQGQRKPWVSLRFTYPLI
jgi:hypothetical protein